MEELDDDFARRLDKRSYSGERFIRVIERSLGRRKNYLHKRIIEKDEEHVRSRSRDKLY